MIDQFLASKKVFIGLLLLAFLVRLYGFTNPLADWHSWRQVDTASVTRHLIENNFDLLHPTYQDLSNVPSGLDNPNGYRFVEFPIYNVLNAVLFTSIGIFSLEEWGRLITIFSSLASLIFIYLILKKHAESTSAFFAAFFFAFLPFSIFYSRVILPDPHMVMTLLAAIYFFDKYLEHKESTGLFITATIFAATSILLKPYAIIFLLPILVLGYESYGKQFYRNKSLIFFSLLSVVPFILWRYWMLQYPEGIPLSAWLFNDGGIRFKGAFFYWLFAERIGRLILGYWGIAIFGIGILITSSHMQMKKGGLFLYSFLLSSLLYMTIIAKGNVQHDYYQILIIPSIVIFLGLGANFLLHPPSQIFNKALSSLFLALCIVFTFIFSWYYVRDYYNINNPRILTAGEIVDKNTPHDAKVIALLDGDTTLLYYTKRDGWASYQNSLQVMIKKGAQYLVMLDPTPSDIEGFKASYEIIHNANSILLVKLTK